jgi:predicted nucleotidyltransferase
MRATVHDVDFRNPICALIPGAQGRLLAVLASTTAELSIRTLARLADVSPAQASRLLPDLEQQGFVQRREVPPAVLFRLTPDHVVARMLRRVANARAVAIAETGELAQRIRPHPVSVILFGSFARGTADAASDIDIAIVRPDTIDEDLEEWASSVESFRSSVESLSGNTVDLLEVTESRAADSLAAKTELWHSLATDGIVVFGTDVASLRLRSKRATRS